MKGASLPGTVMYGCSNLVLLGILGTSVVIGTSAARRAMFVLCSFGGSADFVKGVGGLLKAVCIMTPGFGIKCDSLERTSGCGNI